MGVLDVVSLAILAILLVGVLFLILIVAAIPGALAKKSHREIHEFAAHCTVKESAASFFWQVRRGRKRRSFMKLIERIAVVVSAFFVVLGLAASPRLRLDLDSVPREGED
jgi:hypothetical protein